MIETEQGDTVKEESECKIYLPYKDLPKAVLKSQECVHYDWESYNCNINNKFCEWHGWPVPFKLRKELDPPDWDRIKQNTGPCFKPI